MNTKTVIIAVLCFFCFSRTFSQSIPATANEFVQPYTGNFEYGSNMGYFGNGWDDKALGGIINKVGGRTLRPSLPESFLERYGYAFNVNNFKTYVNELGMKEITCFIGGPSELHRDSTTYPGNDKQSKLFANLYEPIWNADSTVNPNNYYAAYVYKLIQTYGEYIRFWEVVNEPDYAYSYSIAQKWINRAPLPGELPNMQAPVYNYIRMLRITWEVVKKYSPEDFVTTGGIGYTQFLDVLLRYTDNPNDGAVSEQYPNKGGAYFDVLSYHVYPAFNMSKWDNSIGGFRYTRTSDYLAKNIIDYKEEMNTVLKRYGYNGVMYPAKNFLLTETNVSRRTAGDHTSSDEVQRNFGMKALVLSQKNNISQVYFFDLGESIDAPPATDSVVGYDEFLLMGMYENLKRDKPGFEKMTDLGTAFKTTSQLLHGYRYDSARTAALQMSAAIEGAAFRKDDQFIYLLWAKALTDRSETATAVYSFPSDFVANDVYRYEWNYASSDSVSLQSSTNIMLNGSPAIFSNVLIDKMLSNQIINFPVIAAKTFGNAPFAIGATSSSGLPVSFKITSGPATISNNIITVNGAGTIVVEASQNGNNNYKPAFTVSQSFVVNKLSQTLTFPAIPSKTYSDTAFAIVASASSGLPITARVVSGAATVSGNNVTLNGSGWITLEVSQPGDSNYSAAKVLTQGFTVYKASQTIDFAALPSRTLGDAPFTVSATASSGLPVTFRIQYGPATISGSTVTVTGTGLVAVSASQVGSSAYSIAPNVTQSFSVNRNTNNASTLSGGTSDLSEVETSSAKMVSMLISESAKKEALTFSASPNPFVDKIHVNVTLEETEKITIKLFDLDGRMVRRIYVGVVKGKTPQNFVLESTGMRSSTYVLQVTTQKKTITKKIVLVR